MLDPIVSLRQRIRLAPGGFVRLSFATGMALSRDTALALAQKYHDPSAAARTFALAFAHAQSALRHLGISSDEALLFERLASRVLYADGSLRAAPEALARNELGQAGLWPHGISGDLPILLVRVVEEDDLPLVRQVLQAQEYWRLKGLRADVVILNEHPVGYLDEMHGAARRRCSTTARGGRGGTGPAGPTCCAATAWARPSARPAGRRGARRPERGPGRAGQTSSSTRTPTGPSQSPPDLVPSRPAEPAAAADAARDAAAAGAGQRPRRLRRRRARVRRRARRRGRRRRCPGST